MAYQDSKWRWLFQAMVATRSPRFKPRDARTLANRFEFLWTSPQVVFVIVVSVFFEMAETIHMIATRMFNHATNAKAV